MNRLTQTEYYTWWGERCVLCKDKKGNMKIFYPERGIDTRCAISDNNPKLDTVTIDGMVYPVIGE